MSARRSAYGSRIDLATKLLFVAFLLGLGYAAWLTALALTP